MVSLGEVEKWLQAEEVWALPQIKQDPHRTSSDIARAGTEPQWTQNSTVARINRWRTRCSAAVTRSAAESATATQKLPGSLQGMAESRFLLTLAAGST
jgi:hypothetical protein